MTKPVGLSDYECPICGTIKEAKNGSDVRCDSCNVKMDKVWGGRSNKGKDYRWRDQ